MVRRAVSRSIACSLAATALLAVGGEPAHAGTYDVWSCALADGTPAPADGWQPFQGQLGQATNACFLRGGGLGAQLDNSTTARTDARMGWVFTAPSDVTIGSYTLWRWGRAEGTSERGRDYWLYNDAPYLDDRTYRFPQETCTTYLGCHEVGLPGDPFAISNMVEGRNLQIKQVYLVNQCRAVDAAGCPPTSPISTVAVYSARFQLVDPNAPTFRANPSGSLMQQVRCSRVRRASTSRLPTLAAG